MVRLSLQDKGLWVPPASPLVSLTLSMGGWEPVDRKNEPATRASPARGVPIQCLLRVDAKVFEGWYKIAVL
jgi:hypothetical protein